MQQKILARSEDIARLAVDVASDKQASDIVLLDLRGVSDFADYFVILTAETARQIDSLVEEIERALERSGASVYHREGSPQSGWMLLDFGDVIIHLFGPEEREFYNLEGAWARAAEVLRIQ